MTERQKKWLLLAVALAGLAALAGLGWERVAGQGADEGIVASNGRIEAVEIAIAAKAPGRVAEILVREGDFVKAGQLLARMDTDVLEARLRQAQAQLRQAEAAVVTARSQLAQRRSEHAAASAVVHQREAELDLAQKRAARSSRLAAEGAGSQQIADDDRAAVQSATAALGAARAQVAAAEAAIATAEAQIAGAESAAEAARATVEGVEADIEDSALKAPRPGRVQYRVAQEGEVVGAGGRILTLLDLRDVYMTFFLPTAVAGRLALGSEARLVLDAAPEFVIPAQISFVASEAQFTPKTVETADERAKLMFRVRAQIPTELLEKHITQVKAGLPGVAYVRRSPDVDWPQHLQIKLPS